MKRLSGVLVALAATAAFLVFWGGGAAGGSSSARADDKAPEVSGPAEFKEETFGTGLTECPQAGLRDTKPKPLDRRVKDDAEKKADEGNDIRTNQDYACFPQDETSVAINPLVPRNAVAGANDYRLGWGTSGFYATTDGGEHWYDGIKPFPTVPTAHDHLDGGGDPAVVMDRAGVVYYADIHFNRDDDDNGVYVARSTNGGFTWSRPCTPIPLSATDATARCGGAGDPRKPGDGTVIYTKDNDTLPQGSVAFHDKEYIAAGPRPAGVDPACFKPVTHSPTTCDPATVGVDRIYVTWTIFATDDTANIFASFSDDQARSWSAPKLVSGSAAFCAFGVTANACDSNQGSTPSVNPTTGAVYVAYENFNTPDENQYVVSKSLDGGNTWLGPFFITADFDVNYPLSGSSASRRTDCGARGQQSGRRVLTNSCFRVNARGNLVVDRRGGAFANDLYVVISDNRNGTRASTNTDVLFFKSTDGGLTWYGPTRVNDDPSIQPTSAPGVSNRNCAPITKTACQGTLGNDQWYPWVDVSDKGDLTVTFYDRRLDTSSTAGEWPTSRVPPFGRPGNYLVWRWGAHCTITASNATQCVAPTAGTITQPSAPIDPGNELFPEQTVFPFENFGISDTPSNWDYTFRAGIFAGDYDVVTVDTLNRAWAIWTDARNGRSSRTQAGRNPACEQSDAFLDRYEANGKAAGQNKAASSDALFLVTPCPTDIQDKDKDEDND